MSLSLSLSLNLYIYIYLYLSVSKLIYCGNCLKDVWFNLRLTHWPKRTEKEHFGCFSHRWRSIAFIITQTHLLRGWPLTQDQCGLVHGSCWRRGRWKWHQWFPFLPLYGFRGWPLGWTKRATTSPDLVAWRLHYYDAPGKIQKKQKEIHSIVFIERLLLGMHPLI